jgi:hypothetical protein
VRSLARAPASQPASHQHALLLTVATALRCAACCAADGELRQPAADIMRKLAGAKESLGLRVHGLVVGSPEKKRADPAVLRAHAT